MLKKRIFTIICAMFATSSLFAYSFTEDFLKGFYWEVFPIKVKVLMDANGIATSLMDHVLKAEASWEEEAGINLWDFEAVTSYKAGENVIRWSDQFASETGYDPISTLAVTVRYSQETYMVRTQIILNGGISYLVQNFASMLEKTVLHEMGHTIGLGHSEDLQAIMAPMIGEIKQLEYDDIDGLSAVLDETIDRQKSGFVSAYSEPFSKVSSPAFGSCGSVAYAGENGKSKSDGGFLLSALFGLIIGSLFKLPSFLLGQQTKRKKMHHAK